MKNKQKPDNKDGKGALLLRGIPVQLKDKYKAACALAGVSMTEEIKTHMLEYIQYSHEYRRNHA